jgi:2-polyprenyl-3-methyl-5-hydroxy-6-metoxy-1,4-benzoquinol methylase
LRELIRSCYKTPDQPENARRYHASPEFDAACEELKRAGHHPSRGTRILDIGCGNGVACWSLAKEGYEVTGIDSRPGALTGIGAARKLIGKDGSIFKILHTPAGKLPFAPATFDVVWMREELHHIRDLSGFLSSVLELLVPGGVILAMRDPVVWNESQKAAFFEDHPFHRFTNDENCHYLDEYIEGFARAGFTLEKMLDPVSSPINTYPGPFSELATFDVEAARLRPRGNDLFSFLARKSPA